MSPRMLFAVTAIVAASAIQAHAISGHALLIGINDYSASRLEATPSRAAANRDIPNLDGAVNDVKLMGDLLVTLHGFRPADIVTLTDQQATRDAIFDALGRKLLKAGGPGDVVFFYFSGHGSQVRNSLSSEVDGLDESILPADSRRGAPDIRDKELKAIFNSIIDRGAHLTVILDTCHSGSGARGLYGALHYRGVSPDLRDVADGSDAPFPEERGALVLAAAQDSDLAFETMDEGGEIRGAFTWALAQAMRDADPGEPASETFLRAQARLHAERPAQNPVLAGNADARSAPFLGGYTVRRGRRGVVAVEKATDPHAYLIQGGWASGLTVGSELRPSRSGNVRLEVTSLVGAARAIARVTGGNARLQPGALLEITIWAAPPSPPLRIWIPHAPPNVLTIARELRAEASRRGIRWVDDPTEVTPTHLLRWRGGWDLIANGRSTRLAVASLATIPTGAALFVQLPAPPEIVGAFADLEGVELTSGVETADYVVAGRLSGDRAEYACIRPFVAASDQSRSVLPLRTAWIGASQPYLLRDRVVRLRVVQAWQDLRSPAAATSPYRLAIRRVNDGGLVADGRLLGRHRYNLVLREREQSSAGAVFAHYIYVFTIASDGSSVLLFPPPDRGSVENLLPITPTPGQPLRDAPAEIPLSGKRPFVVGEPYGIDTYFLLSTDEPLPNLGAFEWRGVRSPRGSAMQTPLEQLLAQMFSGTRALAPVLTPPNWSIDKVIFESVPPRTAGR